MSHAQGNSEMATATEETREPATLPANMSEEHAVPERQFHRDPVTRLEREIWQPSDGDGDRLADYFEKPGQQVPLEKRWRFYQSDTGTGPIKRDANEPPRFVILDDRAAYEILNSDIPRSRLVEYWSHDFCGTGKIRGRRPHRGRGAIGDPDAMGDDQYHFTTTGKKTERYYFTGEKDYEPIVYANPPAESPVAASPEDTAASEDFGEKPHGHNQWTPKDQLVRYGAQSTRKTHRRYRPRINTFLRRDPSPELQTDRALLYGQSRRYPSFHDAESVRPKDSLSDSAREESQEEDALDLFGDGSRRPAKRRRFYLHAPMPGADGSLPEHDAGGSDGEEDMMFPFHAQSCVRPDRTISPERGDEKASSARKESHMDTLTLSGKRNHIASVQEILEADPLLRSTSGDHTNTTRHDSGTYASLVEEELEDAQRVIEQQKVTIEQLRAELLATQQKA